MERTHSATFEDVLSLFIDILYKCVCENPYVMDVSVLSLVGTSKITPLQICDEMSRSNVNKELITLTHENGRLDKTLYNLEIGIQKMVRKTTISRKGDWKPFVFLFTDSYTTGFMKQIQDWCDGFKFTGDIIVFNVNDKGPTKGECLEDKHFRYTLNLLSIGDHYYDNLFKDIISLCLESVCHNASMESCTRQYRLNSEMANELELKLVH